MLYGRTGTWPGMSRDSLAEQKVGRIDVEAQGLTRSVRGEIVDFMVVQAPGQGREWIALQNIVWLHDYGGTRLYGVSERGKG